MIHPNSLVLTHEDSRSQWSIFWAFLGREVRKWRRSTRPFCEKTRFLLCPVACCYTLEVRINLTVGVPNPQLSEGLPASHSTQGGCRAPKAVLASSASAGLSSVKRVAAQQNRKKKGRRREKGRTRVRKKSLSRNHVF